MINENAQALGRLGGRPHKKNALTLEENGDKKMRVVCPNCFCKLEITSSGKVLGENESRKSDSKNVVPGKNESENKNESPNTENSSNWFTDIFEI